MNHYVKKLNSYLLITRSLFHGIEKSAVSARLCSVEMFVDPLNVSSNFSRSLESSSFISDCIWIWLDASPPDMVVRIATSSVDRCLMVLEVALSDETRGFGTWTKVSGY